MLINIRDAKNNLLVKDILDVDFDMSVRTVQNSAASSEGEYCVWINGKYRFADLFVTKKAAEDKMLELAAIRNQLEEELRNF